MSLSSSRVIVDLHLFRYVAQQEQVGYSHSHGSYHENGVYGLLTCVCLDPSLVSEFR